MPRMVSILMEGLNPVSESARDYLNDRFEGSNDIYIGLDAAVSIGHESVIATALLLVPITVGLTVIGSRSQKPSCWEPSLELMNSGKVKAKSLVTHEYGIDEWDKSYQAIKSSEAIKVVLKPLD